MRILADPNQGRAGASYRAAGYAEYNARLA